MTTLFKLGSVGEGLPHAENTGLVISDAANIRTFLFFASLFQLFSMKMLPIKLGVLPGKENPAGVPAFFLSPLCAVSKCFIEDSFSF